MKILVCISSVPDTTTKIKFGADAKELDKTGVQFIINPYDELGLTKALELNESSGGGTISVINVGEADTEPVLRKCLAIGADEAIRINAKPADGLFVSQQIAEYAKDKDYDLILTGRESIDYNGGQVGGMIAEILGIPNVNIATSIEVNGDVVSLERDIDGGKELVEAKTPLLVSCQKELTEPRIPNMRGIMMAKRKPLQVIEASVSELYTTVEALTHPQAKGECKYVDPNEMTELVRLLHEEAKII